MNKREFRYFVSFEAIKDDGWIKANRIYTFDYQPISAIKGIRQLHDHICKQNFVEDVHIISITEIYRRPKMQFYRKPRK